MWKLIISDNFGRETVNDRLVLDNLSEYEAICAAYWLNDRLIGPYENPNWYRAVPDSYILYTWEP